MLISSQAVSRVGEGGGSSNPSPGWQAATAISGVAAAKEANEAIKALFDHRFVLRCDLTDMPLAKQPYRLRWKDQVIEGVTDEKGQTSAIPTGSSAAEVTCEILGEAIDG